ncbi:MAG: glycosyltransferase [Acidimicrobiaceae bacterium]|jgi:glycosyltransferase involved in cell wall biosynthesis
MEALLDAPAGVTSLRVSPLHPSAGETPSFVVLSTYPPTQCGLATFAASLFRGLKDVGASRVGVIRVSDDPNDVPSEEVVGILRSHSARSRIEVARLINSYDVLFLQHEFGIFGGTDGSEVLELLDDVHIPVVVTMHTVPLAPTASQRRVFEALARRADALVAMTNIAHDRCINTFSESISKVITIPHGATVPMGTALSPTKEISLLTWGLLGPGKGIEWVIDALAMVPELHDTVHYTVAGQTHPKIRANDGESYRNMLKRRAQLLGISSLVTFDDQYRSLDSLLKLVDQSTCVVLPYDSDDQITSGVLVDAVSAGRPVIATAFPHADELLASGAGIVVPHRDPVSLAQAIRRVAHDREELAHMAEATVPIAAEHRWSAVAARYVDLGVRVLVGERVAS